MAALKFKKTLLDKNHEFKKKTHFMRKILGDSENKSAFQIRNLELKTSPNSP